MTFDELRERFAGVVAIPVTPFAPDGRIDLDALRTITARMVDAGIPVVTPNGNTGEYYSLSHQERVECLHTVVDSAGSAAVLAGVGGPMESAIEEARIARDSGAHAVMVHQPVHPYITAEGWVEYHSRIAAAVPELGLVPYLKTSSVGGAALDALARSAANFVAIKYALPDPVGFAAVKADAHVPDLVWIAGLAESYAPSQFAAGATGFTSGLANIAPDVSLAFHRDLSGGHFEAALRRWNVIRAFEELRARDNNALNVSAVKEALHQVGLCNRSVRAPISTLTEKDRESVADMIAAWERESFLA